MGPLAVVAYLESFFKMKTLPHNNDFQKNPKQIGLNKNKTKTKSLVFSVAHVFVLFFCVRLAQCICAVFAIKNLLTVPKSVMGVF